MDNTLDTDEILSLLIYILSGFLGATFICLVAVDLYERRSGKGFGWKAFLHRRELLKGSKALVSPGGKLSRGASLRPSGARGVAKALLVVWALCGIAIAVLLALSFNDYVRDEQKLEREFTELAEEASAENEITQFDALGAIPDEGFSLFSEKFLIPAPLARHVLSTGFTAVDSSAAVVLYGVDWIKSKCDSATCVDLDGLLAFENSTSAFEIFWAAAPTGTNPEILELLVAALALDATTFFAFGLLLVIRWGKPDLGTSRCGYIFMMIFELLLFAGSIAVLAFLVVLATNAPITYAGLAFVSPVGTPNTVAPMAASPDLTITEEGSSNFVYKSDLSGVEREWCPSAPEAAVLLAEYELVPGLAATESVLLTGPSRDSVTPGCVLVGDTEHVTTIASAEYFKEVITYVRDQIINQGVILDALLISMDALVLAASYFFLIL